MDLNLVVLCGRLSTAPELRVFDSGAQLLRLLVVTRLEEPRKRVDVVPVTLWNPPPELLADLPDAEDRVWVTGSIRRRYWEGPDGRRSRLEVVADHVTPRPADDELVAARGREDATE